MKTCYRYPYEGLCPHQRPPHDEHDDGCDLDPWGACPGEIIEKEKEEGNVEKRK